MRITADADILLRAHLWDDEEQATAAIALLERADLVVLTLPSLCEFVWVLARRYRVASSDIASAVRTLLDLANVVGDRPAVAAGLAVLDAGGDFADGVIAHEGRRLGGETFLSFDKEAVSLPRACGVSAQLGG